MTDIPLRGLRDRVNALPYSGPALPTSISDLGNRIAIFVIWLVMFASGTFFVSRYALVNPFVDEWAFVPVLFNEDPAGPWYWELHNEHRFVLPRMVYLGLFRISGDLRTGCWISLIGMSLVAAGLVRLARSIRGRQQATDAIFPLLLMHVGQGENLYMGYQLAFMLTTALAAALLAIILLPLRLGEEGRGGKVFRRSVIAIVTGWLLLMCGAAGLVYGVTAAAWVLFVAIRSEMSTGRRGALVALVLVTPIYLVVYMQGYVRPHHHPPSSGVVESIRIGLEAQSMAFGPAATGMWPAIGVALLLLGGILLFQLARGASTFDPRFVGLLLYVGAGVAVAFGIGWGRSGFENDMGFAWRYGWITAPLIIAVYFAWGIGGHNAFRYGPAALAIVVAVLAPINSISGFRDAERTIRARETAWETDVRQGRSAEEVVQKHFPMPQHSRGFQLQVAEAMRRMREHRYAYYESLGREYP